MQIVIDLSTSIKRRVAFTFTSTKASRLFVVPEQLHCNQE